MAKQATICPTTSVTTHTTAANATNEYLNALPSPVHAQVLNFKANMGISHTSNTQLTTIIPSSMPLPHACEPNHPPQVANNEAQNNALAGVGKPMKVVAWRVSRLNLANLSAEKAAMRNAKRATQQGV